MKKLLTLMLIGSFFAVVSCGPQTSEQQQTEPEVETPYEEPAVQDEAFEGDTVQIEGDTVMAQ